MTQIQLRRGAAASWTSNNPILAIGEVGYETDTLRSKIGDGVTAWNSLAYWQSPASFVQTIGDGSSTTITVTHNLNTRNVVTSVKRSSTYAEVEVDIAATTANTVTLTFATAPALNEFYVTIVGVGASPLSNALTNPVPTASGNSLTLPTTNDTLIGRSTVDQLYNKTLTDPSNTFPTNLQRQVTTITAPTTLGNTYAEHLTYCSYTSTDSSFGNVVLLLHCDGANNSTTITDSSNYARGVVATGAKLSTAQSKFGTASVIFNGTSDYISVSPHTMFSQNRDFTVELWFYKTSTGTGFQVLAGQTQVGSSLSLAINNNKLVVDKFGVANIITGGTTISTNTWYHAAMVKSGSTVSLWLNGVSQGSVTDTGNITSQTNLNFGGFPEQGWFGGYIDEIRYTTGTARYTTGFTAPTTAFPDATIGTPTLPTAVSNTSSYVIKNTLPGRGITVGTTSAQTIDGGSLTLGAGSTIRLDSDGSNWRSGYAPASVPTSALPFASAAAANVAAQESTTSQAWTDLATTTDQVTVTIGASGLALVNIKSWFNNATANTFAAMSFAMSGANTMNPGGNYTINGGYSYFEFGASFLLTGLNAGSTTFKAKYAASGGGTASYTRRHISVIPL